MAITLEHFCTKTGQPIIVDGLPVTETIEHCLIEYFAPSATFKIGVVYEGLTTDEDLKQHQGLSLQFSADDRFFFMNESLREKIFDQPHFGAAYGSNMFTPCKSFEERENLRVLVVDASTGENGGVMPPEEAIKLVGDGDGKIDAQLHQSLGNVAQTPFQTRFGIKSRFSGLEPKENTPVNEMWQLGKGTFAPRDLTHIGNGYDLVISTDQLKGRKNVENPLGILGEDGKPLKVGNEIKLGEYTMTMGIGNKTDAYYGQTSTGAQFWNSFPQGVKGDVLPRLEKRLEELKEIAADPRKIAQDYINSIEVRNKYRIEEESKSQPDIDFEGSDLAALDQLIDSAFGNNDQDVMYRLLKADLAGHSQLLELPKVIDKLQEHWREQYLDCATGRFIKFDSAMAQTCHNLAENEVCYPNFPDGAEVIVYRGPTANSNTVDVYINRHLPDEPHDIGTIKLSPKGLKHSLSDCDGDRMAIALTEDFPHTTAEIKQCQKAENRYAEIIKLDKKAYEGSFEQIALNAMENKVGLIANLCMKGIALENECSCVPQEEAFKLMRDISIGAVAMLAAENNPKKPVTYPPEIRQQIIELAAFCQEELNRQTDISQYDTLAHYNSRRDDRKLPLLSENQVNEFLEKSRKFAHDVVGILGGQLQIEVDRGKSANRCDPEIVSACNVIVTHPDVAPWVEERKIDAVYTTRPVNIKGHGAIDMMAKMTNEAFAECALIARSTQQFQDLFKGLEFTQQQKEQAAQIKKTYDTLMNRAIEISREVEEAPGSRIVATHARGNALEIIGLAEFKHPNAFDTSRKLDMMMIENDNPRTKAKNKWIALAPVFNEDGKPEIKENGQPVRKKLGYVSSESANKYPERMKKYEEFKGLTKEVLPGLTSLQVKAAFRQAREFAASAEQSIPESQKAGIAAAMWKLSTANAEQHGFKKTSAVFALFGTEIVGRLSQLQFTDFQIVGTHKPVNEYPGRKWKGEKLPCRIEQAPDPADPTQNKRWLVVAEGKKLGVFRSESAQLPIGTEFEATITSPPSASVILTSDKGNQLKVGQLKKYAFAEQEWTGEKGIVTINVTNGGKTLIALIDGKPLGVIDKDSFALLSEKLTEKGRKVQGFQFSATLESAPATVANIKVDPQSVRYPEIWTREERTAGQPKPKFLDEMKALLKQKYPEKTEGLMHNEEASLTAILVSGGEEFTQLMQEKGQATESIEMLSSVLEKKLGVESFIGVSQKDELEELYFGVLLPTDRKDEKLVSRVTDALNFPLEYEQLSGGRRTKLIAAPLEDIQEIVSAVQEKIQPASTSSADEIEPYNTSQPVSTDFAHHSISNLQPIDSPQRSEEPVQKTSLVREEWEIGMLKQAMTSLTADAANADEEIQTATFGEGKYRVIHHIPSETLRIVDETSHRGTLYKAQKGKPAQSCELTVSEKESFLPSAELTKEPASLTRNHKPKELEYQ